MKKNIIYLKKWFEDNGFSVVIENNKVIISNDGGVY